MKQYSYQTFPGQTIIRVVNDGYTLSDLLDQLRNNGDGIIIADDDENIPDELRPYIGKACKTV